MTKREQKEFTFDARSQKHDFSSFLFIIDDCSPYI